jgi:uncharacterized protein YcfJ
MNAMGMRRCMVAGGGVVGGMGGAWPIPPDPAAMPAYGEAFVQWAPVIRTMPVYTHASEPRRQCWTEQVTRNEYIDRRGVPLGTVVGGITGGVVGNAIGDTDSDAVTIGSTVTGAIGDAVDLDRAGITVAPVTRDVERCRTVDVGNDVINGYDVTYRYQNRDFTIRMAYDPGDRVQVRVDVEPQVVQ